MGHTNTFVFYAAYSVTMTICCWNMNWLYATEWIIWSLLQVQNKLGGKYELGYTGQVSHVLHLLISTASQYHCSVSCC